MHLPYQGQKHPDNSHCSFAHQSFRHLSSKLGKRIMQPCMQQRVSSGTDWSSNVQALMYPELHVGVTAFRTMHCQQGQLILLCWCHMERPVCAM